MALLWAYGAAGMVYGQKSVYFLQETKIGNGIIKTSLWKRGGTFRLMRELIIIEYILYCIGERLISGTIFMRTKSRQIRSTSPKMENALEALAVPDARWRYGRKRVPFPILSTNSGIRVFPSGWAERRTRKPNLSWSDYGCLAICKL